MRRLKLVLTIIIPILTTTFSGNSQELKSIRIDQFGNLLECEIEILTASVIITVIVDGSGNIKGVSCQSHENVIKYDYYDELAELEYQSKPSKIGDMEVKYYSRLEIGGKQGKMSHIGKLLFDYYVADIDKAGKLNLIGDMRFDYYTRYTDNLLNGKLSRIGNYRIEYFSDYNDREKIGKLRKISNYELDYYTVFNNRKKTGRIRELKSGTDKFKLMVLSSP